MVVLSAIIPPVIYLIWVRNSESFRREPYSTVLLAFLFSATIAIGAAFLIESGIVELVLREGSPFWSLTEYTSGTYTFLLVVIVAPLVEEPVKALGIVLMKKRLTELENGLIYGAAVGLGFAATENILYLSNALMVGLEVFIVTAVVRALTSTVLHASASGITGYGIARSGILAKRGIRRSWLPYLSVSILLHGLFNFFAIMGLFYADGGNLPYIIGLFFGSALAIFMFSYIRRKIRELDRLTRS